MLTQKSKFLSLLTGLTFCLYSFEMNAQLFDSTELKLLSSDFSFTEGPTVDKDGNIFFTDQPNDKIWKYGTDGKFTIFMDKTGRSNGMIFDKKGNLITCADEKNEVWLINKKGKAKVLVTDFEGKKLNGPNDVWVDKKGGIYITDPYYQRSYWERKKPDMDKQNVYYLSPGKKSKLRAVVTDMKQPNGIIGTPDGKFLYIADIGDRKTYKYTMEEDGSLSNKTKIIDQGSDGMLLDELGNLYLAGNGITIFNPEGKRIGRINISGWTANMCFGGKDRNQLFITAGKNIYILPMKVKGIE
jgi:gluconolactonase